MKYQETDKHWIKILPTILMLIISGRKDPHIIAILATESYFRTLKHRISEIIIWFILDIFKSTRAQYISIGICQVQVRHWLKMKNISNNHYRISIFKNSFNPIINYDVCKQFITDSGLENVDTQKMINIYTGRTTKYHVNIYKYFLLCSTKLCSQKK